jgi:hypothetical protein
MLGFKRLEALQAGMDRKTVRAQAICGNGGHDNYGRGEKVPVPKVKEIGIERSERVAR